MVDLGESVGGAGDYRRIESEQQPSKRAYDRTFNYMRIDGHLSSGTSLAILRRVGKTCPMDVAGALGTPSEK